MDMPKVINVNDKVQRISILELKPYEKNNKMHPAEQVATIKKSIEQYGFNNPVVIDSNYSIIAGHGRVLAAKELNMSEVPCLILDKLTEAEIKAFRIMDNKSAESEWDFKAIASEFDALQGLAYDTDLTGFSTAEVDKILQEHSTIVVDGYERSNGVRDIEAEDVETIITNIRTGDIFEIGKHKLLCGDATSDDHNKTLLDETVIDMVFTDPPYGVSASGGRSQTVEKKNIQKIANDELRDKELSEFLNISFSLFKLKFNGSFYICYDQKTQVEFVSAVKQCGLTFKKTIIWNKNFFGLSGMKGYRPKYEMIMFGHYGDTYNWFGGNDQADVWDVARPTERPGNHPTPKPVELCAIAMKNSSETNDKIYDPFGGSGSTMVAAEQLNRICYMMELEPKYCQVIINRMLKLNPDIEVKCLNREMAL